jgi:hypothetical protein
MDAKQRSKYCDLWDTLLPLLTTLTELPMSKALSIALKLVIAAGNTAKNQICGV